MKIEKIYGEITRLNQVISEKYLNDSHPLKPDNFELIPVWFMDDVEKIFMMSDNSEQIKDEIIALLKASEFYDEIIDIMRGWEMSINTIYEGAMIRKDFYSALKSAKKGTDLSHPLRYAFSDRDICNLAKIHKRGRFRRKIEDLLTDCNFHAECGLMYKGDYSLWIKEE